MKSRKVFSAKVLVLEASKEVEKITSAIKTIVSRSFRRRGAVVAISGGIDSSVTAALCVKALGKERVFGLSLPEKESADETVNLSMTLAKHLGIETACENISPLLDAAGCYKRRDDAIREVIPEYGEGWKCKIVLPGILDGETLSFFSVIALTPDGREVRRRLSPSAYLGVVAATNFKQRVRKMMEYYYADRLNYAVMGTPNRLEYDQGFFVKNGDGAADLKPIAHLYKTQVYQLAEYLGVPEQIRKRPPTTDTYSLPQSQEEFYFSLPYDKMDLCIYGKNHAYPPEEVAEASGLSVEQLDRVYRDIDTKRRTTAYLHMPPQVIEEIPEIEL